MRDVRSAMLNANDCSGLCDNDRIEAAIRESEDGAYGKNLPDSMKSIIIFDCIGNCNVPIKVEGYPEDSIISKKIGCPVMQVARENGIKA